MVLHGTPIYITILYSLYQIRLAHVGSCKGMENICLFRRKQKLILSLFGVVSIWRLNQENISVMPKKEKLIFDIF